MFNIDSIFEMVYFALVQFNIVFQNIFTHLSQSSELPDSQLPVANI